jgi:exopolyphosphatase/guanosine-5'-triphosphate,3'-diphosphate pyrophosphatase
MVTACLGTEVGMRKAAVDIGSNSILLAILDEDGTLLIDRAEVIGLGRGLGDRGLFAPDRMKAAESVLAEFVALAGAHGVPAHAIKAIATSGARRAMNARTWFGRVRRKTGLRVEIISGEQEARLTWLGAMRGLHLGPGPRLVIDLGGGSTELVLGEGDNMVFRDSLALGSVRLTETFLTEEVYNPADLAKMKHHIDTQLSTLSLSTTPSYVVGVAGTVTSLTAMALGLKKFDAARIHGATLDRETLRKFETAFVNTDAEQRRNMVPMSPKRADYLLAGAMVLDRVLRMARSPGLLTSTGGIRYGVLR